MKLTLQQKQDIINRIKESETFKNTRTNGLLLQYLHEATVKGSNLKEDVIDIEFFGKTDFTDKNTPRVRVNIYNLRKKISTYYETEGKDEKWQLSIEKGQYQVSFIKQQTICYFYQKYSWSQIAPYLALLIAIFIIIYTNMPNKPDAIWDSILSSKNKNYLYVGDAYGMIGTTITGKKGWTRDYQINDFSDFNKLNSINSAFKGDLEPSPFTYSTSMAVLSVQLFQEYFQNHDKKFSIRFSTRTSASEIKDGNAIYVGTFWNKNKFINFFNDANPYCKISGHSLLISGHPHIKEKKFNILSEDKFQEYAVVSKYKTSNNTEHFVFFSQHEYGVTATVDYFTNADSIKKFTKTYLNNDTYFTAIFKVKGQDRSSTNLKLETVVNF